MTQELSNYLMNPNRWLGLRPWTRHSLVLMVAGLMYMFMGAAYFYVEPGTPRWEALIVARQWMDLSHWGIIWITVGFAAVLSSRWPPVADTWGYVALTGLSAGWSGFYLAGVIVGGTPLTNLTATFVWFLVAFMWWAISGLVNPDKIVVIPVEPPDGCS